MSEGPIPVEFINNANQRTPVVLILDCSGSMAGAPIREVNEGLAAMAAELASNTVARDRVRLKVIGIGGRHEVQEFGEWTDAIDFVPPTVEARGLTPLGAGLDLALDCIEQEKARLKANHINYTRPLLWLITDGAATDSDVWNTAAARAMQAASENKVAIFTIGTEGASRAQLQLAGGTYLALKGANYRELFQFLSRSATAASMGAKGKDVQVTLPASLSIPTST